jgi:predicted transcriptional regulator
VAGRTRTEEVAMTEQPGNGHKTLAIRLPDALHAQLSIIAQLEGTSLSAVLMLAVTTFVDRKRDEGDLAARAGEALADIDREAAARRAAIEQLFTPSGKAATPTKAAPAKVAPAKATPRRS